MIKAIEQMKTHYDVLNLDKDCSSKEIKDAFIELSKKYHPDKNQNVGAHAKFVQVNEAYSVLGKEDTRRQYDKDLSNGINRSNYQYGQYEKGFSNVRANKTYYDYSQYYQNTYKNSNPSGEAVVKTKFGAVVFCGILLAIGTGIQLSSLLKRERDYKSRLAAIMLAHSQRRDENFSNERRIQEMLDGTYRGLSLADAKAQLELREKSRHK